MYGDEYLFTVRSIHGPVIALESVKFPGHFVSASGKNGILVLEGQELKAICVQFTVYISVSSTTPQLTENICGSHAVWWWIAKNVDKVCIWHDSAKLHSPN